MKKPTRIVLITLAVLIILTAVYNLLGGRLWLIRMTMNTNLPDWLILWLWGWV